MATVYVFTNIENGKQYIGQTTQSPNRRLSQHVYDTRRGSNLPFHRAILKYGIDGFELECLTVSDKLVDLWEKHLIKRWKTKSHENGYNICDGGDGVRGRKGWNKGIPQSEETKKKISKSKKGTIPWHAGTNGVRKANSGSFKKGNVSWSKGKSPKHCQGKNNPAAKSIILIHPDGKEEYFDYARAACKKYNLNEPSLSMVSKGTRSHTKGFKAKYAGHGGL